MKKSASTLRLSLTAETDLFSLVNYSYVSLPVEGGYPNCNVLRIKSTLKGMSRNHNTSFEFDNCFANELQDRGSQSFS